MTHISEKAPDFTAQTDGGETVSLSDLRSHWAVVYFYPKDNTSGCTAEACDFRDRMDRIAATGAKVVGISPDSVASHDKFKSKFDLNFTLASDPDHSIAESYGVWGEKSMYGKKYFGIVRSTFLIDPDGIVRREWRKVSVKGHADEVISALSDLRGE
jgi:peroxiredoxin Q/BCP